MSEFIKLENEESNLQSSSATQVQLSDPSSLSRAPRDLFQPDRFCNIVRTIESDQEAQAHCQHGHFWTMASKNKLDVDIQANRVGNEEP